MRAEWLLLEGGDGGSGLGVEATLEDDAGGCHGHCDHDDPEDPVHTLFSHAGVLGARHQDFAGPGDVPVLPHAGRL